MNAKVTSYLIAAHCWMNSNGEINGVHTGNIRFSFTEQLSLLSAEISLKTVFQENWFFKFTNSFFLVLMGVSLLTFCLMLCGTSTSVFCLLVTCAILAFADDGSNHVIFFCYLARFFVWDYVAPGFMYWWIILFFMT